MLLERLSQRDDPIAIVGHYDLMGYLPWCAARPPGAVLALAQALFARTGAAVAGAGGQLVKAVGDAGLVLFPADDDAAAEAALTALLAMQAETDAWLAAYPYPDGLRLGLHLGPVACGPVGPPGDERLDVYGATVNRVFGLKARPVAVSAAFAARLGSAWADRLKPYGDGEFAVDP